MKGNDFDHEEEMEFECPDRYKFKNNVDQKYAKNLDITSEITYEQKCAHQIIIC